MKNANMPAMPTRDAIEDCGPDGSQGPHLVEVSYGGLTKREHIAALAMQATRTASPSMGSCECAALAVNDADALLSALEGTTE